MRSIPSELLLGPEDGLPSACVANLDALTTIEKSALRDRIAALRPDKLADLDAAVRFALGLER